MESDGNFLLVTLIDSPLSGYSQSASPSSLSHEVNLSPPDIPASAQLPPQTTGIVPTLISAYPAPSGDCGQTAKCPYTLPCRDRFCASANPFLPGPAGGIHPPFPASLFYSSLCCLCN